MSFIVSESGGLLRTRHNEPLNLLLESWEKTGRILGVNKKSGMQNHAFNKGGTTETYPFRPFFRG